MDGVIWLARSGVGSLRDVVAAGPGLRCDTHQVVRLSATGAMAPMLFTLT